MYVQRWCVRTLPMPSLSRIWQFWNSARISITASDRAKLSSISILVTVHVTLYLWNRIFWTLNQSISYKTRIVLVIDWFNIKIQKSWFLSAERSQIRLPPHTLFYVGFLDLQFSGSVIHRAATPRIVSLWLMNWFKVQKNPNFSAAHSQTRNPPHTWFHVGFLDSQF